MNFLKIILLSRYLSYFQPTFSTVYFIPGYPSYFFFDVFCSPECHVSFSRVVSIISLQFPNSIPAELFLPKRHFEWHDLTRMLAIPGQLRSLSSSIYIGKCGMIMPATMTGNSDTLVLALATLGSAT
jgi:hypothetical protein